MSNTNSPIFVAVASWQLRISF